LGDLTFISGHGHISRFSAELMHNQFLIPHAQVLHQKCLPVNHQASRPA
jgi:hypothetical protein